VLDVMVLTADSAWGCLRGAGRALQNVALGTGETRYLRYARGQEITIDADPPQPVQFDGDVSGTTPVAMALVRSAIAVLVDGR
jgi:diacylglycerol kinase family enzyme